MAAKKQKCEHLRSHVADWGITPENKYGPISWECNHCGVIQPNRFHEYEHKEDPILKAHREHKAEGIFDGDCVMCNNSKILFSTGDAGRAESMSMKKWDKELADYKAATKQGIQPAGTSARAVREAVEASSKLGSAYNAETMGAANKIISKKKGA